LTIGATSDLQTITTDLISEVTSAAGVTIDGLLIKDGGIGAAGTTSTIAGISIASENNSIFMSDSDIMDTSDTAAFDTVYGWGAGKALTTGDSNTFMGYLAGAAVTTGQGNIMIGESAGDGFDTEGNNLGIGNGALGGSIAGGEFNVAIGNLSLDALTSADYNVAIGYEAGSSITTHNSDVLIGYQAGKALSTGDDGVIAIGYQAGLSLTTCSSSVFIGKNAGDGHDTENHNMGIGRNSLTGSIAGGEYNVGLGNYTLAALTSGDSNTAVGYQAGTDLTTATNTLSLGYEAGGSNSPNHTVTGSNKIVLGNNSITNAYIKVDWTVTSDKRDKTDIEPLTMGLDFVNKLNPVTYRWDMRSDYGNKTPDGTHKKAKLSGGLLAQDVEVLEREYGYKVEDETSILTSISEDGNYGLIYGKFVPVLIKAVQELSAQVTTLQQEINTLKGE
jgi:hypothetical protein